MPVCILPVRTRGGVRIINHTLRAQSTPVRFNQKARSIVKPRIPLHIRHGIQPRQRHLQKRLILFLTAAIRIDAKLRHPDRLARDVVRELDIVLQVAEGVDAAIPMNGHEVDGAVRAVAHKLAEPLQTARRAAVGDGRGAEAHFAGKGLHEAPPGDDGLVDGHAGGTGIAEVGLVEGEEAVGAFVDGFLRVLWPHVGEAGVVVEEQRDEVEGWVDAGRAGRGVALVEIVVTP